MLLKALYDFAHSRKLLDDFAFAPKAIRWVIQLDGAGNFIGVLDTSEDGRQGHQFPRSPKTSGAKNAGGIAEFLADRLSALFGLEPEPEKLSADEKKRHARLENNQAKYRHFWQLIRDAWADTQSASLAAVLRFHELVETNPPFLRWGGKAGAESDGKRAWWVQTAKGEEVRYQADAFTFAVAGNVVLEEEALQDWWRAICERADSQKETNADKGVCLITGQENIAISRTHDRKIEIGFPDTPPGGAAIVSFEKSSPSFSSFGLVQSYNAPTSIHAARAYCEGLNHLIKNERHHLRVGNTLICFWARDSEEASDIFVWAFDRPNPESVREFLRSPRSGIERPLSRADQFYSVSLSGNAGRIVVRHWMQMPLESAVENLRRWFRELEMTPYGKSQGDEGSSPLALDRLALTTVRDKKDLQADVPTQLYRAALEGTAPPLSFLHPMLKRLEVELVRNGPHMALRNLSRFALLRLILNRNRKGGEPMIEPQVFETEDPAYNCGRLLALFDDLQQRALSEPGRPFEGAGVVERYYGAASSAPNSAFGILWRLHQHHLKKLARQGDRGRAAAEAIKRKIAEIAALFPQPAPRQAPRFPRAFGLQEQGRFALGFYQQKAADDAARRARRGGADQSGDQPNVESSERRNADE